MHGSFLIPGYNYLGPGNPLDNGEPVNELDADAQQHDIDYENAISADQIHEADKKAINKFRQHLKSSNATAASLGIAGLNSKLGVEKVFGVRYPSKSVINQHVNKRMNFIRNAAGFQQKRRK